MIQRDRPFRGRLALKLNCALELSRNLRNKGGAWAVSPSYGLVSRPHLKRLSSKVLSPQGVLLGEAVRNIDEWGSGFRFRFNGVTGELGNHLRKNGTRPSTNRLLMGKRLWLASGKNSVAEELAASGLPSLLT